MRDIDAATLDALTGSRPADKITVYVWYDGQPVVEDPLKVNSWVMNWDTTRQVQTLSLEVADEDGVLAPWLLEDPLGVGGSLLQVRYDVGGSGSVNMGWYRITASEPEESWRSYIIDNAGQVNTDSALPPGKQLVYASGGSVIRLEAADLALLIKNDRLLAPDSPEGASPTVVGEITRLLSDIVPVVTEDGVEDAGVSTRLIYEDERLDAVEDLCNNIGCAFRMNSAGHFEIYPLAAQTPVWTIQGGPEGVLVRVNRNQSLDGLYNVFVAEGTTANQQPIRAITRIDAGPLRVDGPHGSYPRFYASTMLTTQNQCDAYAVTMRDTQLAGLTTDLHVTCLPHPALQQGDWVTVASPVINKQTVTLNGKVKVMELSSDGPMELVVECSYTDVQAALGAVNRDHR